jgi:hypothetical protein
MRALLIAIAATTLVGLSNPSIATERVILLNCRLMTETTPWLFRQHCKSENFARLVVAAPDEGKNPKHSKKHVLKDKLYWKIRYLEKKLYAELRECKSYKCKLILKSKLAKLFSDPSSGRTSPSGFASVGTSLSSSTSGLSATTSSLGNAVGNSLSGTTNTIGGVTQSAGGLVSGATNTGGGVTQSAGRTVSGATDTVGGLLK